MAEPFLSEIRMFSFNFPPKGWAFANGQTLPINQNQALFSLLGTTYGGNGQTTFSLPNLQGRLPIHFGNGFTLGEAAGSTAVTVNIQQMPQHAHMIQATTAVAQASGGNVPDNTKMLGVSINDSLYTAPSALQPMAPNMLGNVGGSQPHTNMMPYLVINFCIALQGIFPSRN